MANKTVKVFTTIVDGKGSGPAGDGTFVARFRTRTAAEQFIAGRTYYGNAPTIDEEDAPRRLAERWGVA